MTSASSFRLNDTVELHLWILIWKDQSKFNIDTGSITLTFLIWTEVVVVPTTVKSTMESNAGNEMVTSPFASTRPVPS